MSKLLVVFGATGQQGGSIINYVLNDPELSKQYTLRAITRDASSPAAQKLKTQGVEIVQADASDIDSLKTALAGANTVFAMTLSIYDSQLKAREVAQGKNIADPAVSVGAQYLIFSTLPHVTRISEGRFTHVAPFDNKAEVELYMRSLPIKAAFFNPGAFMQNFHGALAPQPVEDGTFVIASSASKETQFSLLDPVADSGKYVGAILASPEMFEGIVYSLDEIVALMSKVSGKTVRYVQVEESVLRGFLPPNGKDIYSELMLYYQDFGYFGLESKELTAWARQYARGKLASFEEFLKNHPLPSLEGRYNLSSIP
ncbi:NmrA-like family domain-containing protein [Lachnellula subtilissima]|uniref:NmrA-like family domain-containing protein n=1 Tax=Lachnellula subtilissima TaxID=602034 RepID=A0A8H8RMD8_9HELO|nr:NmrA-like family domain-containing protein [Lachnellula subtilissima]